MKRALLASFPALTGLFLTTSSSTDRKCTGTPFQLYNKLICPDCLTATIDGNIECGDNIDHYQQLLPKTGSGSCLDPCQNYTALTIRGDCQYAYIAMQLARMQGFSGYVTLLTSETLPFRKRAMVYHLKSDPNSLILGTPEFYQRCGVHVKTYHDDHGERTFVKPPHMNMMLRADKSHRAYSLVVHGHSLIPKGWKVKGMNQFDNLEDFRRLQNALKERKEVHIIGGNPLSVELYYQIRKEYPEVKVTMSVQKVPPGLEQFVPKQAMRHCQFDKPSGINTALYECQDGTTKQIHSQFPILLNQSYSKPSSSDLNVFNGTAGDGTGNSFNAIDSKSLPNGQAVPGDGLENLHNAIFNLGGKLSFVYTPAVHRYYFGKDRPMFFVGDCFFYDQRKTVNGVTYFYRNRMLVGARGEEPVAMATMREAMAFDVVPFYREDEVGVDPMVVVREKLAEKEPEMYSHFQRYFGKEAEQPY